jgi:uncharacterized protein YjlB
MLGTAKLEGLKKAIERATGWRRPAKEQLGKMVRERKPHLLRLKDDGIIPNHPTFPAILYRGAVTFPEGLDSAAVIEDLFESNGWGRAWRDGIYDYAHYHSRTHEVLGLARGTVKVRLGGARGRSISLKAGDVAILPAGTGHQSLTSSKDLLVVGAYPPRGVYDECTTSEEHRRALKTIPEVAKPRKDPVYGAKGPLIAHWHATRSRNKS